MKIFRATSIFQGKRKLLKTPECKKYIQYSEKFQGNSVFQGKRKKPECKKYIHYSENFQGNSVFFQGKRRLLKSRELWIKFQYIVYSLRGDQCNLA